MLLDSNILIYAAQLEHQHLRKFIEREAPAVSAISYLEVLGYHELRTKEKGFYEEFFAAAVILPVTDAVLNQAVALRRIRKMSLGDAIIAATALTFDLVLVTRNVKDFRWNEELKLIDPFHQ